MANRVNLSIDEDLIKKAKIYALKHGKSLSSIFEEYLRKILNETTSSSGNEETPEESKTGIPWIDELSGSITLKDNRPYKEIIREIKAKKLIDEDIS